MPYTEKKMLKAIIDSLDSIPEALRAEYKAGTAEAGTEGKFVLDVEGVGGFQLENVDGLKTALSSERTAHNQTKEKVKAFGDLDPKTAKDAVTKIQELGTLDPKKDVDRLVEEKLNAQLGQIRDQHNGDLSKKDASIKARDALLKNTFQQEAVVKALAAAKGDVDLLLPHVLPHVAFDLEETEQDGQVSLAPRIRVVDGQGNTRIGKNLQNMGLEELADEFKKNDKYARLFEGSGNDGTGDRRPAGGGGSAGKKIAEMTRKEKSALINELGQAGFNERANQERQAASQAA